MWPTLERYLKLAFVTMFRVRTYDGIAPTPIVGTISGSSQMGTTVGFGECVTRLLDTTIWRFILSRHFSSGTVFPACKV